MPTFQLPRRIEADFTSRKKKEPLALKQDRLATVAEIGQTYDISRNHLTKVAHELGLAGYIVSLRGRGGGIRLARPAEAIILGDVVRKIESDMTLLECIKPGDTSCPLIPACVLRRSVMVASAPFLQVLDSYTLRDLIAGFAAISGSRLIESLSLRLSLPQKYLASPAVLASLKGRKGRRRKCTSDNRDRRLAELLRRFLPSLDLPKSKKGQHSQYDDHQTDEINQTVHRTLQLSLRRSNHAGLRRFLVLLNQGLPFPESTADPAKDEPFLPADVAVETKLVAETATRANLSVRDVKL